MADEPLNDDLGMNDNEIDLYGDAENFDHLSTHAEDNLLADAPPGMDHRVKTESTENDDDLYNAVITERSSPNGNDVHNSSGSISSITFQQQHGITGSGTQQRKYSCYVGNLTWWTTDQDLVDEIVAAGVNDVLDVKFYENRQNGQSKGFALVSFNSEPSVRMCMERLPGRQIHSQSPVALPYTKHSLAQFEAATRKPGERPPTQPPPKQQVIENNKPPGPPISFIGTFRIGTAPPPQQPSVPPVTHIMRQGPMVVRHGGMPPGMPPPFRGPPPSVVLPPPNQQARPPPGVYPPHHIRPGGPPPIPGMRIQHHPGMPPPIMPPPGSHVNPNFYPQMAPGHAVNVAPPPASEQPLSEPEFEEIMNRNRTVSSSAISRAVSDAAAGDYASAIETLVTAISLIRQSKVAHDDRCKILISSLQDTLRGIEAKSFGGGGSRRSPKERRSRSREGRSSKRRRERSRSRSRSRDRYADEYTSSRRRR